MYLKGTPCLHAFHRIPQLGNMPNQEVVAFPLQEVYGKKNRCRLDARFDGNSFFIASSAMALNTAHCPLVSAPYRVGIDER
jgi:hypothetical protein